MDNGQDGMDGPRTMDDGREDEGDGDNWREEKERYGREDTARGKKVSSPKPRSNATELGVLLDTIFSARVCHATKLSRE